MLSSMKKPPSSSIAAGSAAFSADATAGVATTAAVDGGYQPRKSNRVAADLALADGETWHERLAVCEGATPRGEPRLVVRSYFRNKRTQAKVWDEPPSGASNIQFATADDRRRAHDELSELRATLEMIPPEEEEGNEKGKGDGGADGKNGKKKMGFLGRFRRGRGNNRKNNKQLSDAQDLNLQKAIAKSMAEQRFGSEVEVDPVVFFDPDNDDELAMARALSMSEAANSAVAAASAASASVPGEVDVTAMSEDEMLRLAIEESKVDCYGGGGGSRGGGGGSSGRGTSNALVNMLPSSVAACAGTADAAAIGLLDGCLDYVSGVDDDEDDGMPSSSSPSSRVLPNGASPLCDVGRFGGGNGNKFAAPFDPYACGGIGGGIGVSASRLEAAVAEDPTSAEVAAEKPRSGGIMSGLLGRKNMREKAGVV